MAVEKDSVIRFRVDKETHQQFKDICSSQSINPSELMRKWITDYINKKKDQQAL